MLMNDLDGDESGDIIQLTADVDDDNEVLENENVNELPILPIKNTVLFPGVVIPITVSRAKSVKLVKEVYKDSKLIGVITQKNNQVEDPSLEDLFAVGTVAKIIKMLVLPDGNTTIIIQGKAKFEIEEVKQEDPYLLVKPNILKEEDLEDHQEVDVLVSSLKESANKIFKLNPDIPQEAQIALDNIDSDKFLIHFLSSNLNVEAIQKQELLEKENLLDRATTLLEFMLKEIQMLEIKQEIHSKVHSDIDAQQRDYFLRQQMKVLQDELGQEGPDGELKDIKKKGKGKKWPKAVADHFKKECDKLSRLNPSAPEYPVQLGYLELMTDLPWSEYSEDNFDLKNAQEVLNKEHYGLDKVKDRIIEYLAVLKLKKDLKGPILCLYGPPGVGKTSLGKSIAKALGRKYVRMSLGGVHDESEVRGHRKTYIGAMPGKIIQNIKKAKTSNPVFVLDEIDKLSSDFRGDPSSALLEVLDPEQNFAFGDNYLEVEYDLSKVLFIATANSLDTIQPALRDRMEIIEINGYTLEEKGEIAKRHLLPKQIKEHGLTSSEIAFNKTAFTKLIDDYTRESGVRNLERKIGSVVRNVAKSVALEEEYDKTITPERVVEILGPEMFDKEIYQDNKTAGVVTGLAWTQVGGEILFIEASLSRGKGKLTLSGQLGDVMKESAITALSYLRSHSDDLGIDYRIFDTYDLHVHVPAGAVPKDGPSAGITMLTALASVFTQRKVKSKLAMTGEITLRGRVLPVGGIKEKILAAKRAGIKEIILSNKNEKDISEIDAKYLKGLNINYVSDVSEVLSLALLKEKVKNPIKFILE
ncbi:Lon protease [Aureibacter tunicatorum]|nr:Lon protease [Aureibacter tunicatorum]